MHSVTIARFTLVADAQYPYYIGSRIVAVEGKISGRPVRNHQFTAMSIHAPANLRVHGKHQYRRPDLLECSTSCLRGPAKQKLDNPIEVFECLVGIDYPRQRAGLGLRARRPATFASR